MRALFLCVIAVVGLLLGALIFLPGHVDWNAWRPALQARLGERLGADVVIRGGLAVRLLPTPRLAATDVLVTRNAAPSGRRWRMEVASVDARFSISDTISLLTGAGVPSPAALALIRPRLTAADALARELVGELSARPQAAVDAGPGPLGDLIIVDGVAEGDAPAGGVIAAEKINASLAFDATGAATWSADAAIEGTSWITTGRIAPPDAGHRAITVSLGPRGGDAPVKVTGVLAIGGASEFTGRLNLTGDRLDRLGTAAGLAPPESLGLAFDVAAAISINAKGVALEDVTASVGDSRFTGRLALLTGAGGARPVWELKLAANRVDLDRAEPISFDRIGDAVARAADPATNWFMRAGDARLDIAIDALRWRGATLRQTKFAVTTSPAGVRVTQAATQLPGGTDVTLFGELPAGEETFSGRVELGSDNARETLVWLGVPLDGVAADRLRRVSALAGLEITRYAVGLSNLDVGIDTSRLTGDATVALAAAGATARLRLDRIGLDSYLASGAPAAAARALRTGEWLDGMTLRVALTIDEVDYRSTAMRDVGLDLTVAGGALELDLGHVEVEGGAADARLTARRIVAGDAKDDAGSPVGELPRLGVSGTVKAPEGRRLARLLDPALALPAIGPVSLAFSADGSVDRLVGAIDARAPDGTAHLAGTVVTGAAPALDGALEIRGPDLAPLARRLMPGLIWPPATPVVVEPAPVSASMKVSADLNLVRVESLQASIGRSHVTGSLAISWPERAATDVGADIAIDEITATPLLGAIASALGPDDLAVPGARFDGKLSVGVVDIGGLSLSDLEARGKLADGVMELPMKAKLFDGALALDVTISASNLQPFQARLSLDGADLASASAALFANPAHDGRFSLEADLEGRGETFSELIGGLRGQGKATARDIRLDGVTLSISPADPVTGTDDPAPTGGVRLGGHAGGATNVAEAGLTLGLAMPRITLDSGRFSLEGGVVEASGILDLATDALRFRVSLPGDPTTFDLGGSIDQPVFERSAR